jgi:hypothetical protein
MRKLTVTLGLVIGIFSVVSQTTAAQARRDMVCVYENNNYSGWEQCFMPGEQIGDLGNHGKKISSIRVYGDAHMTVFANKNFEGASMEVGADMSDLAQRKLTGNSVITLTWNDAIESVRLAPPRYQSRDSNVSRDTNVYREPVYARVEPPRDVYRGDVYRDDDDWDRDYRRDGRSHVCIFDEINFRGRHECFDTRDEIADLGRMAGWNDRISSIRVYGVARVTVYRDINFRGDRITVDHDVADLRRIRMTSTLSWDNQISSLDVNGGRGHAYGHDNHR